MSTAISILSELLIEPMMCEMRERFGEGVAVRVKSEWVILPGF